MWPSVTGNTVFGNVASEIADLILRILKWIHQGPCHFFAYKKRKVYFMLSLFSRICFKHLSLNGGDKEIKEIQLCMFWRNYVLVQWPPEWHKNISCFLHLEFSGKIFVLRILFIWTPKILAWYVLKRWLIVSIR